MVEGEIHNGCMKRRKECSVYIEHIACAKTRTFVFTKKLKKIEKTFKKGVDILFKGCYYVQARSRAQPTREQRTLKTIQSIKKRKTTVNKLELNATLKEKLNGLNIRV